MKHMSAAFSTKKLCLTALFMAMNILLSSFGIPVPGGHLYLNDIVICFSALVFDPFSAFLIGGVGAFLGDFFFYPAPMFVSLVTHGLQVVVIALIVSRKKPLRFSRALLAVLTGAVIMVAGYTFGKAYIYSTPAYAIIKLPYEIAQAMIGAITALLLCFKSPLRRFIPALRAL